MEQNIVSTMTLTIGAATRHGRERTVNEDSLGLPESVPEVNLARKGHLYIVADGIGGHQAGDVASRMAVDLIRRTYYEDTDPDIAASLQRAIAVANAEIYRQAQEPAYARMGTTVVVAVVQGDELIVAHAGDSRVYLLRKGTLQQLTNDHTWVAERVAAGILTPEEAAHHEMRHIVTRSLGAQPAVEADVNRYMLLPGDRLLLCTDGLWEPVPDPEIARILGHGRPQTAANALVNRAVAAGGADDTTALVVGAGPVRAGVLDQVERAVEAVLASPQGRAVVIGIGAVLILALFVCGITRLFPRGVAQIQPTVTATQTVQVSPTPTSLPTTPIATAVPSTATPSPKLVSTSTPVLSPATSKGYCISPSTNSNAGPNFPANAIDPDNCQQISGTAIPVDVDIWIQNENIIKGCGDYKKIIQVAHGDQSYWIFAWRIGRRSADGTCQPIPDWRVLFGSPRQQ